MKLEDAIKKIKERPYDHYKEDDVEGMESLKNKKQATKNKLRKYIKKIKIENLQGDELSQPDTKLLDNCEEKSANKVVSSPKFVNKKDVENQPTKKTNLNNPFRIS